MDAVMDTNKSQVMTGAEIRRNVRLDEYKKLREEGLLVQLDVTGASMFSTSLEWSEIGVSTGSNRVEWMTKGRKAVYPPATIDRLKSCISKMRQAYKDHTRQVPGLHPWRYLHFKQYQGWVETWSRLTAEMDDIRSDMIAMYDEAVDILAEEYTQNAHEAWRSATANGEETVIFGKEPYEDIDLFTDAVVARAISKMPTVDKIETGIRASYQVAVVQNLEDLAKEEARAAKAMALAQAEAEALRQANDARQFEIDHQNRMLLLEEEQKRTAINAMMQAETDRLREAISEDTSPLLAMYTEVRADMREAANAMIHQIQTTGKLHGRSAKKALQTLSEMFEMRSIVDDSRLRERLTELRAAIGPVGEDRGKGAAERDPEAVKAALQSIADLVSSAKEDFSAEPSRFSRLE